AVSAGGGQPEERGGHRQGDQQRERHLRGNQAVRRQHGGRDHRRGPRQPAEPEGTAGPEAVDHQGLRHFVGCHCWFPPPTCPPAPWMASLTPSRTWIPTPTAPAPATAPPATAPPTAAVPVPVAVALDVPAAAASAPAAP